MTHRTIKATVPITKKIVTRMKVMRSMTAAATIQSFIIRSFSSFSWRSRVIIATLDCSRSRMFTSKRSIPLSTRPAVSVSDADAANPDEDDDSFGRSSFSSFSTAGCGGNSCSWTPSVFAAFLLPPSFDDFMPSNVARYTQATFLSCSHDKYTQRL